MSLASFRSDRQLSFSETAVWMKATFHRKLPIYLLTICGYIRNKGVSCQYIITGCKISHTQCLFHYDITQVHICYGEHACDVSSAVK